MAPVSVLLVDDNRVFLRLAARFLANFADFELVGTAGNADEALARTAELRPQLVLLDLNLSQSSGLELIPRLRQALPQAKIVMLTLWENPVYRQAALDAGADEFVSKARMNNDLLPVMRRLIPTAPMAPVAAA